MMWFTFTFKGIMELVLKLNVSILECLDFSHCVVVTLFILLGPGLEGTKSGEDFLLGWVCVGRDWVRVSWVLIEPVELWRRSYVG